MGEELRSIINKIANGIKYEDVSGGPLDFIEYYTFDGYEFHKKDFTNITTKNGEKIKVDSVSMDDNLVVSLGGKLINITIDCEEIPIWGDGYPESMNKTNYYVERKIMSWNETMKLENIKSPGIPLRELPSTINIITSALNKCRSDHHYQNQLVYFFVWEEDFITIRIPLAYCQNLFSTMCYGCWVNNCYIIYHNEYVRIVKIKT